MTVGSLALKKHGALLIGLSVLVLSTAAIALARPDALSSAAASAVTTPAATRETAETRTAPENQDRPASRAETSDSAVNSDCERQHWPYYSTDCLKGPGAPKIRLVSMTPIAEPVPLPAVAQGAGDVAARRGVTQKVATDVGHPVRTNGYRHRPPQRYVTQRMRMPPPEPVYAASMDASW
jgi:hypothetical protein